MRNDAVAGILRFLFRMSSGGEGLRFWIAYCMGEEPFCKPKEEEPNIVSINSAANAFLRTFGKTRQVSVNSPRGIVPFAGVEFMRPAFG